jgi:hypothetical protein
VPQVLHEPGRDQEHPANQFRITGCQVIEGGDLPLGDDQQMNRGGRLNVVDRDVPLVLIRDLGRHLFGDDLGEDGLGHKMILPGSVVVRCSRGFDKC